MLRICFNLLGCMALFLYSLGALAQDAGKDLLQKAGETSALEEARVYYLQALDIGLSEKNAQLVGDALYQLGKRYVAAGRLDSAISAADRGLQLCREQRAFNPEVFLNIRAAGFHHKGMLDSAVHNYLQAVDLLEQKQDTLKGAYILFNIGNIFLSHKDYRQADDYFGRVYQVITRYRDSSYLSGVLVSLAATQFELGEKQRAASYTQEALEVSRLRKDPFGEMLALRQSGELQTDRGEYAAAAASYGRSYDLAQAASLPYYMALNRMGQANALVRAGDFAEAVRTGEESLSLAEAPGFTTQLPKVYDILASACEGTGDFRNAYRYLSQSAKLRDSITGLENKKIVNDLLVRYEAEKKDRQITEQKLDLTAERSRSRIFIAVSSLALLVILFLVFLGILRARLAQARLRQMKEERERAILQAVVNGEERERDRLSAELHDGLSNALFACGLSLSSLATDQAMDGRARKQVQDTMLQLDTVRDEARLIARNLASVQLDRTGLAGALQQFVSDLDSRSAVSVFFQHYGAEDTGLPVHHQLILFRIVQELTGNALRHAAATEIDIQLFNEDEGLRISVEDNGRGFDPDHTQLGQGLSDLERRVALIGGNATIEAAPGKGTVVSIMVKKQLS